MKPWLPGCWFMVLWLKAETLVLVTAAGAPLVLWWFFWWPVMSSTTFHPCLVCYSEWCVWLDLRRPWQCPTISLVYKTQLGIATAKVVWQSWSWMSDIKPNPFLKTKWLRTCHQATGWNLVWCLFFHGAFWDHAGTVVPNGPLFTLCLFHRGLYVFLLSF